MKTAITWAMRSTSWQTKIPKQPAKKPAPLLMAANIFFLILIPMIVNCLIVQRENVKFQLDQVLIGVISLTVCNQIPD